MRRTILDTDIGTDIDDTWALQMMLGCPEIDLRLIVTATGDTVTRANLTKRYLQAAGRPEIPVVAGVRTPEIPIAQASYRADVPVSEEETDGIQAMIDLILGSDEPITLIAIGPCPNIAEALRRAPEIAPRVDFVGMHGSFFKQYGDQDGTCPETNVVVDVAACRATFAAPWRSVVITPLDTCGAVVLTGGHFRRVADAPGLAHLIENHHLWYENSHRPEYVDVLNASSCLFDTVAVYLSYDERFCEMEEIRFSVTDDGHTVLDPNGYPARAAMRWRDLSGFYDHLVERLLASQW